LGSCSRPEDLKTNNLEAMKAYRQPPRLAQWVLKTFYTDRGKYTHLGDFIQVYDETYRKKGRLRAWGWYWMQTFKTLPWILSNKIYWSFVMFQNYITAALRNIFKNKGFSLINITGLSIGMAACLLIFLFVQDELSYDAYHDKADRIYRIAVDFKMQSQEFQVATIGPVAADMMISRYPEVENAVRFRGLGDHIIQYKDKSFRESGIVFTDPSFFQIFSIPLIAGNPDTALAEPHSLVLSQKMAEKYFRSENPLGKILKVGNQDDYRVTGVIEKIPDNTHFHYDFLLSMATLEESQIPTWLEMNFQTYLLLKPESDPKALEAKFPELVTKYVGGEIQKITGMPAKVVFGSGQFRFQLYLQPLRNIHLHSDLRAELEANSDIKYVYIFTAIALFILIIASINFMNLSTARSAGRAKEVGVRKVLGSKRIQLVRQFLSESIFFSIFSMILALFLVSLFLPSFNHLSGKSLSISSLVSLLTIGIILLITILTGIFSGVYPAFFLSAFQPVKAIKGELHRGVRSSSLRNSLVVFQFMATIILIIGTLSVYRQLQFIQNRKLGFEKEHILVLDNAYLLKEQTQAFKEEMLKHPEFVSATITGYLPVPSAQNSTTVFPEGDIASSSTMHCWTVDYDYIRTLGMTIVLGRNFSREYSTDTSSVIINQRAAAEFGWEDPIGKKVSQPTSTKGDVITYNVIGVVEDFHFESLRDNIAPLIMSLGEYRGHISFRVKAEDIKKSVTLLKKKWSEFLPTQPFDYYFMDDRFDTMYRSERRIGEVLGVFTFLAVMIGCLGLFGLASFTAERRTKEIGIRKVLGASIPSIAKLLLREFFILIVLANLIAWPIAYYVVNRWLRGFAYRAPLSIWIFLAAGFTAILIAMLTVSYQAIKSAVANPVNSLRYE
jgi:putative ABC transport system permease protein